MQTFDQSLLDLFQKDLITYEDAVSRASNADDFALKVKGVQSTQDVYRTDGQIAEESETKATPDIERFSS
jgi:twitching motility protein PilT